MDHVNKGGFASIRERESNDATREANCEIVEEGVQAERVLVVLRAVWVGKALTIAAREDEEYDEWELDPNRGEMVRIDKERSDSGEEKH
eukprot:COSAG02_NODE_783_length_17238_cov_173.774199_4_plen_89_part_00